MNIITLVSTFLITRSEKNKQLAGFCLQGGVHFCRLIFGFGFADLVLTLVINRILRYRLKLIHSSDLAACTTIPFVIVKTHKSRPRVCNHSMPILSGLCCTEPMCERRKQQRKIIFDIKHLI
jgi:hypothetical protein